MIIISRSVRLATTRINLYKKRVRPAYTKRRYGIPAGADPSDAAAAFDFRKGEP